MTFGFLTIPKKFHRASKFTWWIVTFLALCAGLAALWFIGLQLLWLRHLCPYCLGVHACGLGMAGMIAWRKPAGKEATRFLAVGAILGVAILIVSQIVISAPETFELIEHKSGNAGAGTPSINTPSAVTPEVNNTFESPLFENPNPHQAILSHHLPFELLVLMNPLIGWSCQTSGSATDGPSAPKSNPNAANAATSRRTVKILVSISLDITQWPLLGKPDAKYVMVEMLDYTCPHCQNTDVAIRGAMEKYIETDIRVRVSICKSNYRRESIDE